MPKWRNFTQTIKVPDKKKLWNVNPNTSWPSPGSNHPFEPGDIVIMRNDYDRAIRARFPILGNVYRVIRTVGDRIELEGCDGTWNAGRFEIAS